SWNVIPESMVGHSSGETAAAFSTGAITRELTWTIAYYRGQVSAQAAASSENYKIPLCGGSMMSVAISEAQLASYPERLDPCISSVIQPGCINSPQNITVTASEASIDALTMMLDDDQIFARKLSVKVAYHSPQM
ncbi:hypothetical protein DM02DRAFT_478756, partial [Periconia macrospinosa]